METALQKDRREHYREAIGPVAQADSIGGYSCHFHADVFGRWAAAAEVIHQQSLRGRPSWLFGDRRIKNELLR